MNVEGRNLCLLEGFKLSSFRRENFSRKKFNRKKLLIEIRVGGVAASSRDNSLLSCFYF